jgi:DNA polymerase (family 10)
MNNKAISQIFEEMANILEIQGADFFRVNAYKKASFNILNLPFELKTMTNRPDEISKLPGIGEALFKKIMELLDKGSLKEYEKIKKKIPAGLIEMLKIRTLGPKKIKLLYSKLKIEDIKQLKEAAENHKIRGIEGMGEKSEEDILKAIHEYQTFSTKRFLINFAFLDAQKIISYMRECEEVKKIEYAGSLRRMKETIGDIDVLVAVKDTEKKIDKIMEHFTSYREILNVVAKGKTKSSVILKSGIQVDLRVVLDESFGAAMHYFTGDKQHNIKIRDLAKKKGLKVSEYGVFKGKKKIAGKSEKEVFKALGLPYIIPEIRKDDGEVEYAKIHKKMPNFLELSDIRGDLHNHSNYSDGKNSIEEMAYSMIDRGYEYFAITDHSSLMGITKGMNERDIRSQWREIDRLNKKFLGKIKILKGCEVDILKNGELDFPDSILKELDLVVIAAHMHTRLSSDEQTARLISAIENPYVNILAHPFGRLINRRSPMEFNTEKIIEACVNNNVALEINSNPLRLDLSDTYVKVAKAKGAKIAINTDSHNIEDPKNIIFGVGIGRSGWLEKSDILNTKPLKSLTAYFGKV